MWVHASCGCAGGWTFARSFRGREYARGTIPVQSCEVKICTQWPAWEGCVNGASRQRRGLVRQINMATSPTRHAPHSAAIMSDKWFQSGSVVVAACYWGQRCEDARIKNATADFNWWLVYLRRMYFMSRHIESHGKTVTAWLAHEYLTLCWVVNRKPVLSYIECSPRIG